MTSVKNVNHGVILLGKMKWNEEMKGRRKTREGVSPFDISQIRKKIKRHISICCEPPIKVKTKSDIQRF